MIYSEKKNGFKRNFKRAKNKQTTKTNKHKKKLNKAKTNGGEIKIPKEANISFDDLSREVMKSQAWGKDD